MAIFQYDPVDATHSVVGPLFRRVATFYLAGLAGVFAGIFCNVFAELDSYIDPHSAIIDVGEATTRLGLAWPIMVLFKLGPFATLIVPLMMGAFYAVVIARCESDLWLISIAVTCTLIASSGPFSFLDWLLLACIMVGYLCLAWVSLQRKWPHVIESASRLMTFGLGEKQFDRSPDEH